MKRISVAFLERCRIRAAAAQFRRQKLPDLSPRALSLPFSPAPPFEPSLSYLSAAPRPAANAPLALRLLVVAPLPLRVHAGDN